MSSVNLFQNHQRGRFTYPFLGNVSRENEELKCPSSIPGFYTHSELKVEGRAKLENMT